jgi:hypothetical protein
MVSPRALQEAAACSHTSQIPLGHTRVCLQESARVAFDAQRLHGLEEAVFLALNAIADEDLMENLGQSFIRWGTAWDTICESR